MSPRKATGIYEERVWADGETVSYGARVRCDGKQHRLKFGTNKTTTIERLQEMQTMGDWLRAESSLPWLLPWSTWSLDMLDLGRRVCEHNPGDGWKRLGNEITREIEERSN